MCSSGVGYDFKGQSFDSDDFHCVALVDRSGASRGPVFPFDEDPSTVRIDRRQGADDLSKHRLSADFYGQALRSETFADNEQEKPGGQNNAWDDVSQREGEKGVAARRLQGLLLAAACRHALICRSTTAQL